MCVVLASLFPALYRSGNTEHTEVRIMKFTPFPCQNVWLTTPRAVKSVCKCSLNFWLLLEPTLYGC